MLSELFRRLRGQVRVLAECRYPERILNLCGQWGLAFGDLRWESPTAFSFRLSARDFRILCRAVDGTADMAADTDCTFHILDREGVPAFFARFARRPALLISLAICAAALFLGSFFIWDYDVRGNEAVPTEEILRALEKEGLGLGACGLSLDGEDLRNRLLLDLPGLRWIGVNVSGCKAEVTVRERIPPPEILDESAPTNVVARRDGLILAVAALDGVAEVLPGMTVTQGQLLISGVEHLETTGKARVMAGHGSVKARTWHTLTTTLPLTIAEKRYHGEEKTGLSLIFGKRRIKFFSNSRLTGLAGTAGYDKITERTALSLFGFPLPAALERETYRFYEAAPVERSAAEIQRRGEEALKSQLEAAVEPYGEIRSALCSSRQRGDALEVTLRAECVEEIGLIVPVETIPG